MTPPSDDGTGAEPPILSGKYHEAPSVFTAEALLREARRQKRITDGTAPNICILDPDGDIVRYLLASGRACRLSSWPCYHTELYAFEHEGLCEPTWPFFRGFKLGYLLNDFGYFHNGHRAINDCHALLHLLAQPLPRSRRLAMSILLDNARKTEFQLWAENAPFEFKDVLKARGYRWDGAARCWYIVLDETALPAEEEYLYREVCPGRSVPFRRDKITARNRFSLTP